MDIDTANSVKYTLRTKSLLKRIESERTRRVTKKKEPKEKQKPPPLSKYRRKTANARERNRMKEMNEAFETLQKTLPNLPGADSDRLTKITVLRLAVNYIKILSCVVDGDIFVPQDIDEVKEMWCMKNAHMTKPEHCVRSVFRSGKINQQNVSRPTKVVSVKQKTSKPKATASPESNKDKNGNIIKKRSSKSSRTRGKVCKTASVATSNGAYITLKNVAFQTPASRLTHLDNKPLMMSMTVKRPRLEPMTYQRPPKFSRYEPPLPKPKIEPVTSETFSPNKNKFSNIIKRKSTPLPSPINNIIEPPSEFFPPTPLAPDLQIPIDNKYLTNFTIYDLDSPVVKNDVILEFPKNNRHYLSPLDSNEESIPSSPKSPLFPSINTGACSPNSSISMSSVSPSSYAFSDTDSALPPSSDLDSLLGSDSFDEGIDHLTSSFIEADALNLFLEHTTPSFI